MAQVKKFNTGGSVQKMKYGSIIKNGTRYEMDEESMKRLEQHIAAADPDIQQSLANDWKLLMSGQDVTIDTMANQRSTIPTDFSKGQLKRLDKDKPTEARWHGIVNSDIHKYNLATQHLGKFDPTAKVEQTTPKTKLEPRSSVFSYTVDKDGNRVYDHFANEDEIKLYDNIAAYIQGDDAYRSGYDISGWTNFNDVESAYKKLNDPDFLKNLRVKLLAGKELDPNEIGYLTAIRLKTDYTTDDAIEQNAINAELKAQQDEAWRAFNVGNVWDDSLRDKQIIYDAETNSYGLSSQYAPPTLPEGSLGYYFNDDFLKQYSGYGYDWLNGKVVFNNQWYNESDLTDPTSQLYQMLNNPNNDYYNKNRRGDYAGADAILKTDWDGVYYVPTMTDETAGRIGAMYQNPNLRYIEMDYNMPGATYNNVGLDETYNIWRYQDLGDEVGMDGLGRREERWTITDAYGNPVFLDGHVMKNGMPTYNFNDFSGLYNGATNVNSQKISYTNRVSTDSNDKHYYDRYADTPLVDANGTKVIEGWINPITKNAYVAINRAWGGTEDTVFIDMPLDVYSALKDLNFANNLNSPNNRLLLDQFKKLIQGKKSNITVNDLISLGMSSETVPYVIDYFKRYWMSNPVPVNRPKMKNGGTLYLQSGGPIKHVGSTNYISDKVNQLSKQMSNPTASKVIGDGTGLTELDMRELWALALDLGSAIAGYTGIGDIPGIIGGQGANWLRFSVDKQRKNNGLDTKPWRNYLTSTGIDLLSLVPIIGDNVNLGKFGTDAINTFKRLYTPITTSLGVWGMWNAKDAIDKIISGEKLTIEDAQALASGLQALTGVAYRGHRAYNDARLAAATEPKPKDIKHEFKFKNGDQEITKTLEKGDIDEITGVKGKENIKAKLAEIYKAKGVPEDQIPDLVRNTNYEQLGLVYRDNKWYYKDTVSEQKPDKTPKTGYYMIHPNKRNDALGSRKPADVSKAAQTKKGLHHAAGRWAVKTGNVDNMQGTVEVNPKTKIKDKDIWFDKYAKYNEPPQQSIEPAVVTADAPKPKTAQPEPSVTTKPSATMVTEPVVSRTNNTPEPEPTIRPVETNQHFGSDEFDQKFTQYQAFIRGNGDSPSTNQFKKRFEEFAQKDDFRKLSEDNPELVRLMIDEEIANVLGKGKRTRSSEARLKREIESIKQKHGLKFKTGGVIKAQNGLGQFPYDPKESRWMPEAINQTLSAWRLSHDIGTNNKVADIKAQGLIDSSNAKMASMPQEIYSRQNINAGNAERLLGNRKLQALPAVNNDYIKYAAMKRAGDDAALNHLANATLADSQQHSENLAKQTEEQRMYANQRNQIETYNRGIQAAKIAGLSELRASQELANRQSFSNYLYERQTAFDQNRAKMEDALLAENRLKWQKEAETGYNEELQRTFGKQYNSATDKGNLTLEQWLNAHKEFDTNRNEILKRWKQYVTDNELAYQKKMIPGHWMFKSGGKVRSAKDQMLINAAKANDQIKVNKHKSFDKNWESNNTSVRKAIGKMHDRVYNILMKILS